MKTTWTINTAHSDLLLKSKKNTIGYLEGNKNIFEGYVNFEGNELKNASISFAIGMNSLQLLEDTDKNYNQLMKLFNVSGVPVLEFTSTEFQKINNNISFFKGNLTIKDITKVFEFQAEFIDSDYYGTKKVAFEITGNIDSKEFGLSNLRLPNSGQNLGRDIKFIGNFEFTE